MSIDDSLPPRQSASLVHVMKTKLRNALSTTTPSETESDAVLDSRNGSPSAQTSPVFPSDNTQEQQGDSRPTRSDAVDDGTRSGASNTAVTESSPSSAASPSRQHSRPHALPTPDFYERFPRAVGPTANVVVTSHEEYKILLMTAKHIKVVANKRERSVEKGWLCQEDIQKGGFLVYHSANHHPQYFQLKKHAADVYGTATYISA
ncbi:hypothetical protein ABB37_09099 [Leptomonas pyrrhocoris]|uniref:Uncharacterized protein n=1 Tax=Leptomonas pyrrhocoris TaxID=157538 RepID=A0A0M9FRA2_LEPPY|nr:hypothetical protein ABB37_09099 [Leptomonas pyrrhocoris]KPA74393.1 hypothetical protein ABB37_09099 [Leptomonas pyrrhocoris]|eukprot:XP_015652832.1 hypothetical protein ABB37_09099 [Leptomonas pyrrhocoris]